MTDAPAPHSFSIARVLMLVVPLAIALYVVRETYSGSVQEKAKAELEKTTLSRLLGRQEGAMKLARDFNDADGDMVADPPRDADKQVDPAEINFSYVATSASEDEKSTWKELLDAIGASIGKKVNLVSYVDVDEQKRALKNGDLQVTAFGTGDVQGAVNEAGFVPFACFADKDGHYHYTMKIIVPADSPLKKVEDLKPVQQGEDLKKHRFTFVRPNSNSGCTLPLVMLIDKYKLQPERDYNWGFSYGHEKSIDGIAAKQFEAAAVASDLLERRIASGTTPADAVRTIYESDPYPPGVIGYAYNLKPDLRDKIRKTILDFKWESTGLEKAFGGNGSVKFAEVSYKDDWKGVRDTNDALASIVASLSSPSE